MTSTRSAVSIWFTAVTTGSQRNLTPLRVKQEATVLLREPNVRTPDTTRIMTPLARIKWPLLFSNPLVMVMLSLTGRTHVNSSGRTSGLRDGLIPWKLSIPSDTPFSDHALVGHSHPSDSFCTNLIAARWSIIELSTNGSRNIDRRCIPPGASQLPPPGLGR